MKCVVEETRYYKIVNFKRRIGIVKKVHKQGEDSGNFDSIIYKIPILTWLTSSIWLTAVKIGILDVIESNLHYLHLV